MTVIELLDSTITEHVKIMNQNNVIYEGNIASAPYNAMRREVICFGVSVSPDYNGGLIIKI